MFSGSAMFVFSVGHDGVALIANRLPALTAEVVITHDAIKLALLPRLDHDHRSPTLRTQRSHGACPWFRETVSCVPQRRDDMKALRCLAAALILLYFAGLALLYGLDTGRAELVPKARRLDLCDC